MNSHCAAPGLNPAPAVPMFTADRITLQPIRSGLIPFNAAIVGFVEATRKDIAEKNRLCPPNRLPDVPLDWVRGRLPVVEGPSDQRMAGARAAQSLSGPSATH